MASAPQPQVLPKEVRLSAPPTMPQARSYLFRQQPTSVGSTTSGGGTITINIPRLQRSYLTKESYLRFTVNYNFNPGTTTAVTNFCALDQAGAYSLINKIEVFDYLGSTLLESTAGHGQLMCLLSDLHMSNDQRGSSSAVSQGYRPGLVNWEYYTNMAGFTANQASTWIQHAPHTGEVIYDQITTTTRQREYAIPLFSFLGVLSDKYAPLHNGYTIVITLNTAQDALIYASLAGAAPVTTNGATTAIDYTIQNLQYECQVLELGPVAESMLLSSTQGQPLVVHSKAYRQYIGAVPAQQANYKLDINLNVASLTNILWFMRGAGAGNASVFQQHKATLSSRIRNFLYTWYFQYGSSVLPQTSGIQARFLNAADGQGGSSEAFSELLKSRHIFSKGDQFTSIEQLNYQRDQEASVVTPHYVDASVNPAKFACGLDLELVSGKSQEIISGLNTNGMNTSINLQFDPNKVSSVQAAVLDLFAEYDAFVNVAPGLATTVSF